MMYTQNSAINKLATESVDMDRRPKSPTLEAHEDECRNKDAALYTYVRL